MVGVFSVPDRVRTLLELVGKQGPCCKTTRRTGRRQKNWMEDFIFVRSSHRSSDNIPVSSIVFSAVSSAGIAALAAGSLGPAAAAAACVPIIVPMTNALVDAGIPIGDDAKNSMAHLMTVNSLQLSFGLIEFLTGDIVNGFTHMMMAGVGFYVVKVDGIVLLPSYSVASSVFAGVSALNVLEMLLYKGTIGDLPLTENLLKLATIAHPFLYAASAYIAWSLIDQLRTGLLRNVSQTAATDASMMLEPTVLPQNRAPFAGRAFRLDSDAENTHAQTNQ
jgi:hypothetical protein